MMNSMKHWFGGFAILVVLIGTTFGQSSASSSADLIKTASVNNSEEVTSAMNDRLSEFEQLMSEGKVAELFDYTPPVLRKAIVKKYNVTEAELKDAMRDAWDEALKTVSMEGFSFDTDAFPIRTLETGQSFKIIPTTSTMGIKSDPTNTVVSTSETLALTDNGMWYFVRLDKPDQIDLFKVNYPDLSALDIKSPVMERLQRGVGQ